LFFFIPECELLIKQILLDQLGYYKGIYDFEDFNVQNPTIVDDVAAVPEPTSEEVKIEEAAPVEEKNTEPVSKDTVEDEARRQEQRLEKFNIDYSKIQLPSVDLESGLGHPIFSILKTINSYSKILVTRLKFNQA